MKSKIVISDDDNISFRFGDYRRRGKEMNCDLLVPQRYESFSDISSILKDMLVLVTERAVKSLVGELTAFLRIFHADKESPETLVVIIPNLDKKKLQEFENSLRTKLKTTEFKGLTLVCKKKL